MRKGESELRRAIAVGAQPAEASHVRSVAVLVMSIALLTVYLAAYPVAVAVSASLNVVAIVGLAAFGTALMLAASRMKVWMLHAALLLVICAVLVRLSRVDTVVVTAIVLSVMTWCSVLAGLIGSRTSARIYLVLLLAGTGLVFTLNPASSPVGVWLSFAVGYLIIFGVVSSLSTKLRRDAVTDPLTGLRNRKGLLDAGAILASVAARGRTPLIAIQIDLEDFKAVNDREGHERGDRILADCADAWLGEIRAYDVLARAGGDEFTLLLLGSSPADAELTLERMRAVSPIGWSAGLAVMCEGEEIGDCIRRADIDLLARRAERGATGSREGEDSGHAASGLHLTTLEGI